ncbi:MAG: rRNA maturation RNase YbeY [Bacteroidales bacterium]|nr:rRNA maturation RNase YbeY [Bacteroidales bacterium]
MAIRFFSDGITFHLKDKRKIQHWLKTVASEEEKQIGDISYIFVSDKRILEINQQFLQHDYYTDIITFDDSDNKKISGEMYISIDTVSSNAKEYQAEFHNELLRVIVHGLLHLCGYNDKTEKGQEEMRHIETKYLNVLESTSSM